MSYGGVAQVGKFGVVGILNTLIDFAIFNLLSSQRIGFSKVRANICSTTVAMIFSFFANRQLVFSTGSHNPIVQAILFFIVTSFGLYVLQTGVLYLLVKRWQWPAALLRKVLQRIHLTRRLSLDFTLKNGAKVAGTLVSLTWNFFIYKYVVFR